jgi:dynein heavy chain, axonemal
MVKLWLHECLRVFQDRLISLDDRAKFQGMLSGILESNFRKKWEAVVKIEPLLFGSFVPLCYPGGDETKKPYQDVYCELTKRDKVSKVC